MSTLQITQEEIDVMTRSGARSSITSTIFKIVPSDFHGRGSPCDSIADPVCPSVVVRI